MEALSFFLRSFREQNVDKVILQDFFKPFLLSCEEFLNKLFILTNPLTFLNYYKYFNIKFNIANYNVCCYLKINAIIACIII